MTTTQLDVWGVFYRGKLLGLFTDEASAAAHKKEYNAIEEEGYEVRHFMLMPATPEVAAESLYRTLRNDLDEWHEARQRLAALPWRDTLGTRDEAICQQAAGRAHAKLTFEVIRALLNDHDTAVTLKQQLEWKQSDYSRMADSYAEVQDTIYAALRALEQVEEADLVEVATATMQQLKDAKADAARWKGAYQGAQNAVIANRTRYHQLLDLYGATDGKDPMSRLVSLGEAYMNTRDAVLKACNIIERGDERLLASDGPAGGQPPDLSLEEWSTLYETLRAVRGMPMHKGVQNYPVWFTPPGEDENGSPPADEVLAGLGDDARTQPDGYAYHALGKRTRATLREAREIVERWWYVAEHGYLVTSEDGDLLLTVDLAAPDDVRYVSYLTERELMQLAGEVAEGTGMVAGADAITRALDGARPMTHDKEDGK